MTDTTDTTDRERNASQRFVERLAEHYRPAPLEPAQRARFDAKLRERVSRRHPAFNWIPSLAGAFAAIALAWWVWPASTPLPQTAVDVATIESSWEAEVLSVDADGTLAEEEYLPDEYMVIAFAFLDEA